MFVYNFVNPDLGVEMFFEKDGAKGKGIAHFKIAV